MPDGIFVLDKPAGWTSTRGVSLVRRLTGTRRVGHAGTLDPMATGVLPICVGRATRVVDFIHAAPKSYTATLLLGVETDSGDSEGTPIAFADAGSVTREMVAAALPDFTGEILQAPPAHSAIKIAGVPAYRLARAGRPPDLAPRRVEVYALRIKAFDHPRVVLGIECGRGTYIRALARDLGRRLGCGAHLVALRREAVGSLGAPVTPEDLEDAFRESTWCDLLLPLDTALRGRPAAVFRSCSVAAIAGGRDVSFLAAGRPDTTECVAYSEEGEAVAILARVADALWHPRLVFAAKS